MYVQIRREEEHEERNKYGALVSNKENETSQWQHKQCESTQENANKDSRCFGKNKKGEKWK